MPHSNPKIDKFEKETRAVIHAAGKKDKGKNKIDRDVMKATGLKIIANVQELTNALPDGPAKQDLQDGIDHTQASIDSILDDVEAAS